MNSLDLSKDQQDRLLEMCVKLFPEYNKLNISIHDGECDLCLQNVVQFRNSHKWNDWTQIHWFELCQLHIFPKVRNLYNAEHLSDFYYVTIGYNLKQNGSKSWDANRFIHPVDYLYKEFLKLNKTK